MSFSSITESVSEISFASLTLFFALWAAWISRSGNGPASSTNYEQLGITEPESEEFYLRPRRSVWMKQIGFMLSFLSLTFVVVVKIHVKDVWATISCGLVMVAMGLSFAFENRYAPPSNSRKTLVWLPCFVFAAVSVGILLYSSLETSQGDIESKVLGFSLFWTVVGVIFHLLSSKVVETKQRNKPTVEFTSGLFTYVTFSHVNNLMRIGGQKINLEVDDIPTFVDDDTCEVIFERVSADSSTRSLMARLFSVVATDFIHQNIFQFMSSLLAYCAPLSLQCILFYVSSIEVNLALLSSPNSNQDISGGDSGAPAQAEAPYVPVRGVFRFDPFVAVALLFLGPFIKSIIDGQNYVRGRRNAVRMRAAIISLVYRKALTVDLSALAEGTGTLSNLISVDTTEIAEFVCYFHFLWCTVFEMGICLTLLFLVLGIASLGGVAVMVCASPLGVVAVKYIDKYQTEILSRKDERMGLMNEVLNGIRIIKWFAWERNFMEKVSEVRDGELRSLRSYILFKTALGVNWGLIPTMVGLVAFLIHTQVLKKELSPGDGFASLLLFNILRRQLQVFPEMINSIIRTRISVDRVVAFLDAPDVKGLVHNEGQGPPNSQKRVISCRDVSLGWKQQQQAMASEAGEGPRDGESGDGNEEEEEGIEMTETLLHTPSAPPSTSVSPELSSTQATGPDTTSDNSPRNTPERTIPPRSKESDGSAPSATVEGTVTIIQGLDVEIPTASLVAVVGSTGSGKSTLVSGLMGECEMLKGTIRFAPETTFSLVTQSAWIQNASLRDNILFGLPYEERRYREVVSACALDVDLKQLRDGDLTDIGEKGVNLSGGQQQRVSLARAAYSHSKVIIFDDPLSAVDAHVGDHIFSELICNYLRDRTRILVTHQVALVVPRADLVICLDGLTGVAACCRPAELSATLGDYIRASSSSDVVQLYRKDATNTSPSVSSTASGEAEYTGPLAFLHMLMLMTKGLTDNADHSDAVSSPTDENKVILTNGKSNVPEKSNNHNDDDVDDVVEISLMDPGEQKEDGVLLLVEQETKASGSVGLDVYWAYFYSCGGVVAVVLILVANFGLPVAWFVQNYTLGEWMKVMEAGDRGFRLRSTLWAYLGSVVFVVVMTLFKAVYLAVARLRASRVLHADMLDKVLGATVTWHDSQPVGRKVNRFSQDVSTLDTNVMDQLDGFFYCLTGTLQVLIVILWMLPWMLPCMIPVFAYNNFVSSKYIRVSRELKRLESVNKSPVFVLFSESLSGLSVIRSFRQEQRFFDLCCKYVDVMNRCHFYMWLSNRWLNCRTQIMCAIVSGVVAFAVVLRARDIGSTVAGLILIYSIDFSDSLTFLTRMHAECQMSMNSIERIVEYHHIDQEAYLQEATDVTGPGGDNVGREIEHSVQNPLQIPQQLRDWPTVGRIEFKDLCMQYRPSTPLVLKDVSFVVEAGSKVGVCGRSGAGKSSLITALFRTVEPVSGELIISGVDVLKLPLELLRSNLAIVPQEPVLFKGSIKSNMDPFSQASDDEIWAALTKVHMAVHVAAMPGGTGSADGPLHDKVVAEKGSNLSVGQRQLLCMARAILRNAKILILDEATASVDAETDALIQETVRNEFDNVTVLSIAHRLNTIAFYDKVLVMDKGSVAELDTPSALLSDKSSIFHGMCERSGDLEAITAIALAARNPSTALHPSPSPHPSP